MSPKPFLERSSWVVEGGGAAGCCNQAGAPHPGSAPAPLSAAAGDAMAKPPAGADLAPLQRRLLAVALLFAGASERAMAYYSEAPPEQLQCSESITNAAAVPGPGTVYGQPQVGALWSCTTGTAAARLARLRVAPRPLPGHSS